jgi:hypothetical protein
MYRERGNRIGTIPDSIRGTASDKNVTISVVQPGKVPTVGDHLIFWDTPFPSCRRFQHYFWQDGAVWKK